MKLPAVAIAAAFASGILLGLHGGRARSRVFFQRREKVLAAPLAWPTTLLLHVVQWFAHLRGSSYRIPGPPVWLILMFFAAALLLAAEMRLKHPLRRGVVWGMCMVFATSALTIGTCPLERSGQKEIWN